MAPGLVEKIILDCLAADYGLKGSLSRLSGENLNFLLLTGEGERFVVKIVDEDMPPEVVEMEFEAMEFAVSAGFPLQMPRIVENLNENIETRITLHLNKLYRLRILNFIDGKELEKYTDISDKLVKNVGISLADFHLAMKGFEHPAAGRSHRWNLAEAGQHRDKIELVDDAARRALLEWGFDVWGQSESVLDSLPWQFIHGDMNPENIMVDGDRVTGLVDFGDSCLNPAVCDLAICLTYLMMGGTDPVETAALATRGYHEQRPLGEAELSVLLPLICGRLAVSIAVSSWRRTIDPGNPNWFSSEDSAWRLLGELRRLGGDPQAGLGVTPG
jgi:Ser/Thr protein kinase RdoA (MazF antagonist)